MSRTQGDSSNDLLERDKLQRVFGHQAFIVQQVEKALGH
jgi:hypothetical protein